MSNDVEHLAEQVAEALGAADPERFADLLDPQVTWGAPGDPSPPCRNRRQVLAWYQRGRAEGRRGQVESVTVHGEQILVSMTVTSPDGSADGASVHRRWQVLSVANGRITDIRGYDDERAARQALV